MSHRNQRRTHSFLFIYLFKLFSFVFVCFFSQRVPCAGQATSPEPISSVHQGRPFYFGTRVPLPLFNRLLSLLLPLEQDESSFQLLSALWIRESIFRKRLKPRMRVDPSLIDMLCLIRIMRLKHPMGQQLLAYFKNKLQSNKKAEGTSKSCKEKGWGLKIEYHLFLFLFIG